MYEDTLSNCTFAVLMAGDGNNTNFTFNPLGECSSKIFDMMSNPTGSIKIYCDEKGFLLQNRYAFSTLCHGGYETSRVPKEIILEYSCSEECDNAYNISKLLPGPIDRDSSKPTSSPTYG